jgi:hypothetical protein
MAASYQKFALGNVIVPFITARWQHHTKKICFPIVLVLFITARWQHHAQICLGNFVLVLFITVRWQHHANLEIKILYSFSSLPLDGSTIVKFVLKIFY